MAGAEEKSCRRFMELLLREMKAPLQEGEPAPARPLSELLSEDELEGECLDMCLQHLYKYNCPCSLAAALARASADSVLQIDFSQISKTQEGAELPQVEALTLARLLFNALFDTCGLWVKELPFHRRPQPYYETSIHAIKNMRRKMEDKHVIIPDFNTLFNIQDQEEQAFFAVFDGHGGVDAANFAATHLHVNLAHHESFSEDLGEALYRAFRLTDEQFVKKASREHLRCGTTGVVTFLRGRTLHVAWLGDSQVILVRRGQVVELMKPHKPDREDEKKRIEALGGCVIWFGTWRVNGSLSVSRAIGDSEHKPYICGDADHSLFPLDGSEDYLILACDGFWDTVVPEEAVRVVTEHLSENTGDTTMVAHKLVASARDAGSSDNITVMVVFLRDPRSPAPPGPPGPEDEEEAACPEAEPDEEEAEPEEEEEEEEEEEGGRAERGGEGGSNSEKTRGWPLQQCSAPADLTYEDRTDSLTDRTTLSLGPQGPPLSLGPQGPPLSLGPQGPPALSRIYPRGAVRKELPRREGPLSVLSPSLTEAPLRPGPRPLRPVIARRRLRRAPLRAPRGPLGPSLHYRPAPALSRRPFGAAGPGGLGGPDLLFGANI